MKNIKQQPIKEIRLGSIKAAVWKNDTEAGVRYNVTFSRLYRDGDSWKSTDSFGRDDLLLLGKVADHAHTWICSQNGIPEENQTEPLRPVTATSAEVLRRFKGSEDRALKQTVLTISSSSHLISDTASSHSSQESLTASIYLSLHARPFGLIIWRCCGPQGIARSTASRSNSMSRVPGKAIALRSTLTLLAPPSFCLYEWRAEMCVVGKEM